MSEIEDAAKAVTACANLGDTSVKAVEKSGAFFAKVFGTTIENAVGIIDDELKYLRWERRTRLIDRVNEYHKERGLIEVRPIPPKFAIPLIVNATLEEENDLQDIWCKLIANALDPNFDTEIRYAFIEIIKSLTSLDAKILRLLYIATTEYGSNLDHKFFLKHKSDPNFKVKSTIADSLGVGCAENHFGCSGENFNVAIDNLFRTRCLEDAPMRYTRNLSGRYEEVIPSSREYKDMFYLFIGCKLTPLGLSFVETCIK
ncbi:MAG: DUF4393 domain-containing protein [Methanosarcinales archaeon]|nr:DUF4393 domain-containing protein [Methanosarcinales archaeon]